MMEFKSKFGADGSREETRKLPMSQPMTPETPGLAKGKNKNAPTDRYTGLAQQMLSGTNTSGWSPGKMMAGVGQMSPRGGGRPMMPQGMPNMGALMQFLKTPQGRDAIRSSVDHIIATRNNPNQSPSNPRMDLIQSLMQAMNGRAM